MLVDFVPKKKACNGEMKGLMAVGGVMIGRLNCMQ